MKTFREIDMSIHSLLDTKPVETPKVTAEEILEKYRENEAQAEKGACVAAARLMERGCVSY